MITQTDRELFARLAVASLAAYGELLDRKRQRQPRVDFTRPGFDLAAFTVPTALEATS